MEYYPGIRRIVNLVLGMLALSILWIIHSILFRTVGYRADWIRGYNSVHTENPGYNNMCRLWVLGGAQGHPTWRTPAGQCFGIYLAVLSWFLALAIHIHLTKICFEDLVLFHLMLWVPPATVTLAVIFTQLSMCKFRASCGHNGNDNDFLSLIQTYKYMEAAVISYRLGRDCLQVENHIGKYRIGIYRTVWWDWFLAQIVYFIEIVLFCISYPCVFILRKLQTLGVKLFWKRTFELDMKEKNEAYRTLCEHCLSEDIAEAYENSGKENHVGCLQDGEKDRQVQEIFRNHRINISLPLLLDNSSPARLSYLLHQLDIVLKENPQEGLPLLDIVLQENPQEGIPQLDIVLQEIPQEGTPQLDIVLQEYPQEGLHQLTNVLKENPQEGLHQLTSVLEENPEEEEHQLLKKSNSGYMISMNEESVEESVGDS